MKGVFTLGIYIAIGITGAAFGQQSTHPKNVPAPPPPAQQTRQEAARTEQLSQYVRPQHAIIREWAPWTAREATPAKDAGNRGDQVRRRRPDGCSLSTLTDYQRAKTKVEVRGPCYSACTLVLAYVERTICIAEGAFMAFHAVRSKETGARMDWDTGLAYRGMPPVIRMWIDDNGGHENLPLNGYWTLYDRQLWAMGYPKCQ